MSKKKLELYFHIPFCVRKCLYCDFLSAPAGKETQDAYMEALLRETKGRAEEYRDYVVDTIFVGGGTPTMVDALWILRLMEIVRTHYTVSEKAEITLEMNPGTVDERKLAIYADAGVNRLSIGLQSAEDAELRGLGRIHTWQQFLTTYQQARRAGFANINVDVMSALPGQTYESYVATLQKVLELQPRPEHISAYSLIVEEGTPFFELYENGKLHLPDEDCERRMYEATESLLGEFGYSRYEISNYAKEGYRCRHNCGYWCRTEYVGFGIGAASLVENQRFQNDSDLKTYLENPLGCRSEKHILSMEEQMEEFMFLGLRMTEGVSFREFRTLFGREMEEVYGEVIAKNRRDGLLQNVESSIGDTRIRLTQRGMDISNYVMAQFLFS